MKKLVLICLASMIIAAGCAKKVAKDWVPTGGSRADATVEMSFEYNPNSEIPELDQQKGLQLAIQRCQVWGYQGAEAFGGAKETCTENVTDFWGHVACKRQLVTMQHQCLGRGDEQPLTPTK